MADVYAGHLSVKYIEGSWNMKSGNKTYVILMVVVLIGFSFFFTTKLWLPDDRVKQNGNYDQIMNVGDWTFEVGGTTKYDAANKILLIEIYKRSIENNPKPYHISVFNGNAKQKDSLSYSLTQRKNDPDTCWLEVKNVPVDYYYISVVVTANSSLNVAAPETNEAGSDFAQPAPVTTTVPNNQTVEIDYRLPKKATLTEISQTLNSKPN
jgi:hypothetical protein